MSTINIECDNSISFINSTSYKKNQNDIWIGVKGKYNYCSFLYFGSYSYKKRG